MGLARAYFFSKLPQRARFGFFFGCRRGYGLGQGLFFTKLPQGQVILSVGRINLSRRGVLKIAPGPQGVTQNFILVKGLV
jgi:hypothetical protein